MITAKKITLSLSVLGLLFLMGNTPADNSDRYNKMIHSTGVVLREVHYSPKKIDDKFSQEIFDAFIDKLDPDKNLLLADDIRVLQKYRSTIDDEITRDTVAFFYNAMDLYTKRVTRLKEEFATALSKPFDFSKEETLVVNSRDEKRVANEQEQLELWRKKTKYMALQKYADLLSRREKTTNDSVRNRTDAQLEAEAREFTARVMAKFFDRLLNKGSLDTYFSMFMNTITNDMDPHTDFFMPVEKRAWDEDMTGKFYGIGAIVGEENGYIIISSVSTGGAAWKSGEINGGDVVLSIGEGDKEPVNVVGYEIPDAVRLIRGNKGTVVKLTIKKADGSIKTVALAREELKLEETFAKSCIVNDHGRKIGYIYLPKFYSNFGEEGGSSSAGDVAKEIEKLKEENIDGLVIDLRDNGGGSLSEAIRMVGLFIPSGPVVQVKSRDEAPTIYSDRDGSIAYSGPLEVMVNEFSASASEIFAAAIQDYKRGIITGSTSTYGKGSVQRPVSLNLVFRDKEDLGTIHVTMQKYYRINGGATQLRGVTPDIILPGYYEFFDVMEKDNKTALPWDEIAKADYKPWTSNTDLSVVVQDYKRNKMNNAVFEQIRENTKWLSKENKQPVDLNIEKYKVHLAQVRDKVEKTRSLLKLKTELNIESTKKDAAEFEKSADKKERSQRWINQLKTDVYIGEAMNIMQSMIGSSQS